jgi:glucokinase
VTVLVGDVGGTKVTLSLYESGGSARPVRAETFASQDFDSLEAVVAAFAPGAITRACFAVAGPVHNGISRITNLPWNLAAGALGAALHTPDVTLINDLQATAYGVLFVEASRFAVLHGAPPPEPATIAVIAPGTGLGEARLYWDGAGYHALPSEGGHADFAPESDREIQLLRRLREQHGHVSYERVLSGDGIGAIYSFLRDRGEAEPPWVTRRLAEGDRNAAISALALTGDDSCCVEALDLFCAVLGAEAGNLALRGLATGGVVIAGGILPHIIPVLTRGLVARFLDKGRFSAWIEQISLRVVLDPRAPLYGALHWRAGALPIEFAGHQDTKA